MAWFSKVVKTIGNQVDNVALSGAAKSGREVVETGVSETVENAAQKVIANGTKNAIGDTVNLVKGVAIQEGIFQPAVTQGKGAWKTVLANSTMVQGAVAATIVAGGVATAVAIGKGGDDLLEGAGDMMSGTGTLMEYAPLAIGAGVAIVGIYYLTSS